MVLEVSESRVSQLHTKALQKLRKHLGKSDGYTYKFLILIQNIQGRHFSTGKCLLYLKEGVYYGRLNKTYRFQWFGSAFS